MRILTKTSEFCLERDGERGVRKAKNNCYFCDSFGGFAGSRSDCLFDSQRQGI